MIVVDTNIISEMMKPFPNPKATIWIDKQEIGQLFVTAVTIAEISYGLQVLPQGTRRDMLTHAFEKALQEAFGSRIFAFDESAAHYYGKIMAARKELGLSMGVPDGQIAAIASSQGAAIATRNIHDFVSCGVAIINPFD